MLIPGHKKLNMINYTPNKWRSLFNWTTPNFSDVMFVITSHLFLKVRPTGFITGLFD